MPTIYGNSIDLDNAKDVLSDRDCYDYVNTEGMTDEEISSSIKPGDVIVGGTGAIGGVGENVDTSGATRLGGLDRDETKDKIQAWEDAGCATCQEDDDDDPPTRNKPPHYPPPPQHIYKNFDKYTYFFGIDKIQIKHMAANNTCCLVTPEVFIDKLDQDNYIQLEANYITSDVNSIEFYIIDGALEIPILPINDTIVSNEKIFYGMKPRFSVDYNSPIEIKRNGVLTPLTIDNAIQLNDAIYTVSYTPLNPYNCKPINSSVKIKIIERLYEENANAPYVAKMRIRKYGGDTLWQ
jgi:hypothetical protein